VGGKKGHKISQSEVTWDATAPARRDQNDLKNRASSPAYPGDTRCRRSFWVPGSLFRHRTRYSTQACNGIHASAGAMVSTRQQGLIVVTQLSPRQVADLKQSRQEGTHLLCRRVATSHLRQLAQQHLHQGLDPSPQCRLPCAGIRPARPLPVEREGPSAIDGRIDKKVDVARPHPTFNPHSFCS